MIGNFLTQLKSKLNNPNVSDDANNSYKNGIKMLRIENYQGALEEFKLAAAAAGAQQGLTFFYLGTVYFNLNSFPQAKNSYEKFLELHPKSNLETDLDVDLYLDSDSVHADVYNNLGIIYSNEKNFIKAIGCYHRAIRIKRDNIEPICNLGEAYFKMGLYPDAIKAYERALTIDPNNVIALYGLGLVYVDLKYKEEVAKTIQILEGLNQVMASDLSEKIFLDKISRSKLTGY